MAKSPEERQRIRDKLRAKVQLQMARQEARAAERISKIMAAPGMKPEEEAGLSAKQISVQTQLSMELLKMAASRERAQTQATAGPRVLGLLVGVAKAPSIEAWEAQAQAKDLVVDTTLGPAQLLPPKDSE